MVVFVATHHNPQSAAHRQSDITPESFPGLNAIAQQKFDLPYYELSPALQSHVREEAVKRAAPDMLAALKEEQFVLELTEVKDSPSDFIRLLESVGDYESGWQSSQTAIETHSVRAALLRDAAIALAEGRA